MGSSAKSFSIVAFKVGGGNTEVCLHLISHDSISPFRFADVIGKLLAFLVHSHQIAVRDAEQPTHNFAG